MGERDIYSNVARLARVYQYNREGGQVRWLYARGLGTNSAVDVLGSAFGKGGQERIHGALHCLQQLIAEYDEVQQAYPAKIVLDVFGFSRGAALARHFVNVIKQGAFEMDAIYRRIPKDAYRISFLGVFDTVSSFGKPGNNTDLGYAFHVAPHWLDSGGLHLVADDEHRANFPLQAILAGQDLEHPRDLSEGTLKEVVLPGAHSDVGGGYKSQHVQGQSNNDLARVALEYMYCEARSQGVPLDTKNSPDGSEREEAVFWSANAGMKRAHTRLMALYASIPQLRALHRRARVLVIAHERLAAEAERSQAALAGGNRARPDQRELHLRRTRERSSQISTLHKNIEREIEDCFDRRRDHVEFINICRELYGSWVHKSHSPHNRTTGMTTGMHGLEGRREVFYSAAKSLVSGGTPTRATPRAFKAGAWIDRECLEAHSK